MNAADNQNVLFRLDLAYSLGCQPAFPCRDLTRFQRASIGSGQSTRGGCDDVVESGGVRFQNVGGNFIVLRDSAVNAE